MRYDRSKGKTTMEQSEVASSSKSMIAPSALAVTQTGNEVYAVAALNVQSGAVADDFGVRAKEIGIQIETAIFEAGNNLNTLLEAPISELIKAYSTARGYTTSVNYTDVSEYVFHSLNALSLLLHMYRAQNGRQVKSDNGYDLGSMLSNRASLLSVSHLPEYVINGTDVQTLVGYVDDGAVNINNTDWARQWLTHLTHFKLSPPLVKFAVSMFSVHYQVKTDGVSSFITFIPSQLQNSASIAVKTRYDASIAAMLALRNANADLVDILNFLGFTNDDVIALDFTRDARQLSLPIVQDEFLTYMYVNTNLEGIASNDDDLSEMFFDINGTFTVLNYADDAQLSADFVFASRYLRNSILSSRIIKYGGIGRPFPWYSRAYWPGGLSWDLGTLPAPTQAQLDRLRISTNVYSISGLPQIPFATDARVALFAGTPTINGSATITEFVSEGANTYKLPDSFDFYTTVKKAEIIMDNTEYRAKLQSLSNSIRTNSITKSS